MADDYKEAVEETVTDVVETAQAAVENTTEVSTDATENVDKVKKDAKQFLNNVLGKLGDVQTSLTSRFDEAKKNAPEGTSDVKVVADQIAALVGEGTAKAKATYEELGGINGISENATRKVAEFGATAKVFIETASDSKTGQAAINGIQSGAQKVQDTKFFQGLKEQALHLKEVAVQTYEATYESKKGAPNADEAVE
jgi:hypothetical protein